MVNKIFKLFCAFSLCFFSTPLSYARDDSHGFERPDEGAINSRGVAFNSSEAASILSDFKEKKAEQINALRNNVNVYLPPVSNVEHSLNKGKKNNLELKLENEAEVSAKKFFSEEADQNLPHEVLMDLPESLPEGNSKKNKNAPEEINLRNPKIEGLISSTVLFHAYEDKDSDSSGNARDIHKSIEKDASDASSLLNGHSLSQSIAVSPYFGQIPSPALDSFFTAEAAPLILQLENELNADNSDLDVSEPQEENIQPVSEEKTNPSLDSEVQENENPLFLTPKIVPEEILPETDAETIEEYEIQESPDFSQGLGAFLRFVSEEGFFYGGQMNFEFAEEGEDFSDMEEVSAQCLENPADAACQDLFVVFITQPLLFDSAPSGEEDGITLEDFALMSEENNSLMMESNLLPEETQSASFALLASGTDNADVNANPNGKKSLGENAKNASASSETAPINGQGRAIEVPLGMPDFYLPWQRAVLHGAKFVKVDAPAFQKSEPESLSKIQARVAPEEALNYVMPQFSSEDAQKGVKKADESPLDIDFNFPLKSIFERPLPSAFPMKAMIQPQHNIQVSPISSYQIQDVPMEWQIYEWFFEFCTDLYYYDWNWMLWLNQEENRFLRKLDN